MGSKYPPIAYCFKVVFAAAGGTSETLFQEVSGLESEIATEDYEEPCENRYVHKLPKGASQSNLVLKRGIAPIDSPLVAWCRSIFESDVAVPIVPMPLLVSLMNETGLPIRTWSFANACPVKWSIDSFSSTKNEVAIEMIELRYTYMDGLV